MSAIVETTYGKIRGEQSGNVSVWKGIPFAKPPIGSLRFRAPEPPEAWDGIRDATQFGPVAAQPSDQIMEFLGNKTDTASEDCLYLNIWSQGADDKRRPVLVWIHGGAFKNGSGSSASYDGTSFAENGDVVVVTINYRLGIMGFLHLAEIGGEEYAASGNCGILDQVAALKWVQENIARFGGDPARITVFGESAGAMSIGVLLALPSAKGLFQQAILESGAAGNVLSSEQATGVAQKLLTALDVSPEKLSKLEEIPIEQLIEASTLLPMMSLGPVVDGVYLPKPPLEALADGCAKDVVILMGTNKDEFTLFTAFDPRWKTTDVNVLTELFEHAFSSNWPGIAEHFLHSEAVGRPLFDKLMTIHVFETPAIKLAEVQVKHDGTVYMYRFDWETPIIGGGLKSCHALELPFVWNSVSKPGTAVFTGDAPGRQQIADQMQGAWIAFARYGNPNTELLPHWPKYDLEKRATMLFNTESKVENDPSGEDRVKWEKSIGFNG